MTKTIYKKDTSGKIRYLEVSTKGANIINESGVLNTDSPVIHIKTAVGKNIGRSNETTPEEQAELEVKAYIKKKLKKEYFETFEEAVHNVVILPMLAEVYSEHQHKIDWTEVFVQDKLDGMRCLAIVDNGEVKLISRDGSEITTMGHIKKAIPKDFVGILDGELYIHGESFQTNMSYIKKYVKENSETVKFHVYDSITPGDFVTRHKALSSVVSTCEALELVSYQKISSETELKAFHSRAIGDGYEGTMVRWGEAEYKVNGRSANLLKYKDFIDSTAVIVDIIPADQRPDWGVPVFEGFKAGVKLSHAERKELLLNKEQYIGMTAEIRYFELTDDRKPRFPVMVGIRLDK